MAVFGVDFGTLHSVVSVARRGGIDVIINEVSKRETSSMVSFGEKERHLGEKALDQSVRNWRNTIGSLKRLIGVKYDSDAFRHESKFLKSRARPDERGYVELGVEYKYTEHWFKPEQLTAMLFTQLRQYADREACEEAKVAFGAIQVLDCVVSCPVYYTAEQRKLLQQALQITGLNPLSIINEPTAAALDWGIFKNSTLPDDEKNSLVVALVDIGHSSTTASLVSFMKGQLKVVGHVFDYKLGCRDLDATLFDHFAAEVKQTYRIDLAEDKKNYLRLFAAIDKLKKVLSANAVAPLNCEMGDVDVHFPNITREMIETLWAPQLTQLRALLERLLALPGADQISAVEIIGGGSRIPCVKATVAEVFGKTAQTTLNASESIAKGCGIMAAMLSPKFKVRDFSVIDAVVLPVNLGYFSDKTTTAISDPNFPEINKKMAILKYGDACPKTLNLVFDRSQDFDLYVYYEDSAEVRYPGSDLLVGKWKVSNLPPIVDKTPAQVKVNLRMNPSMVVSIEGAFVLKEWEEEEVVEVPKKEEPAEGKKEEKRADGEAASMDTDKEKKPETEKQTVKRKKSKKHECVVTPLVGTGHSDEKVKEMQDLERTMVASDLNVHATAEMKNQLEEYILSLRSKLGDGGQYHDYMVPTERKAFLDACTAVEDWLYGDGDDAAKDDYYQKLQDLRRSGEPPAARHRAFQEVGPAVDAFRAKAQELRAQALDTDGKLAHVPGDQLRSVVQKADALLLALEAEAARCLAAPKTAPPTLTAAAVQAQQAELVAFATPILNTPKPKEEKKEEKKDGEASPAPASPTGEKPAEGKMDLD
jgi:molecular chaperone DnaK (HSP70)